MDSNLFELLLVKSLASLHALEEFEQKETKDDVDIFGEGLGIRVGAAHSVVLGCWCMRMGGRIVSALLLLSTSSQPSGLEATSRRHPGS